MNGLLLVVIVLAVGTVIGLTMNARDGRFRDTRTPQRPRASAASRPAVRELPPDMTIDNGRWELDPMTGGRAMALDFGEPLGERATLVQFSTAFCQPCRATRRVLGDVAALVPGVRHIEVDAENRLDLVREFEVMRTPTVLVLDGSGTIVKRASGQPRKADVIAALGAALGGPAEKPSQSPDEV